jgi:hypothetical protein
MTHDELLAKIVNYPDTIVFAQYYRALRAVIELHKPSQGADDLPPCLQCGRNVSLPNYSGY